MEIILEIATILGGVAAILYFLERYWFLRGKLRLTRGGKPGHKLPPVSVKTDIDAVRINKLVEGLRAGYPGDREKAARALAAFGESAARAVPALRKCLRDPSVYVRNASAAALSAIGTNEALKALSEYEAR